MQIVQTLDVARIQINRITGFAFVFSHKVITQDGIEVFGMRLVGILRGHLVEGKLEAVCVSSFLADCQQFTTEYSLCDDIACTLWNNIIIACQSLLARQLCQQALLKVSSFVPSG